MLRTHFLRQIEGTWTPINLLRCRYKYGFESNSLHGREYFFKSWYSLSLSKENHLLYGNRRFITVFSKARHWTILSQPNSVHPIDPYLPNVHPNIILPPTARSSQCSSLRASQPKTFKHLPPSPCVLHVPTMSSFTLPYDLTEHHAMKAYWESGGIAPRILNLGTRWRWVVSFTTRPFYLQGKSPWYPLDRGLGGPQSRSGGGGEEKNSQPPPGIDLCNTDRPTRSHTDFANTVLSWKEYSKICQMNAIYLN
jgi:hypothetical protein